MVVISTLVYFVTQLFQPLAAALFVVRQTNHLVADFGLIPVTAELGVQPNFADLDAFVAAAGYAEAAVVHGLGDPPFVKGGWTISTFEFPPQPKNATMVLTTQAVQTNPRCENLTPQINKNADGSYNVTATRNGCTASFGAKTTDGKEPFGVTKVDNCGFGGQSATAEDRFKPVVFWFFTFDGPTASMVFCSPLVETFQVSVNVSLSTQLINSQPTQISEVTSNVTSGQPFNGLALNG
jgi:hypothetical protein